MDAGQRLRSAASQVAVARLPSPGTGAGAPPGNLLPVAYDWRLSCRYNGQRLSRVIGPVLERWRAQGGPYTDAQVVFVCHSMGGLVARWYIEKCGGAEVTRKLITLGTPYRGAARALDQLVNGAPYGLGPFQVDLTGFARSMPSLHQLLPEYACLEQGGDLAKTTEVTLPELRTAMVADAMAFHTTLQAAEARRPASLAATHAIVGTGQPTPTTARLADGRIELTDTYQGENLYGDSTVPIVAACRPDVTMDSNTLRRVPDRHGALPRNIAALDEVEGILVARDIIVKAARPIPLRVGVPDFALAGETITVQVTLDEPDRQAIHLAVRDETGTLVEARTLRPSKGTITVNVDGLAPGAYTIDITGSGTDLSIRAGQQRHPRLAKPRHIMPLTRRLYDLLAAALQRGQGERPASLSFRQKRALQAYSYGQNRPNLRSLT